MKTFCISAFLGIFLLTNLSAQTNPKSQTAPAAKRDSTKVKHENKSNADAKPAPSKSSQADKSTPQATQKMAITEQGVDKTKKNKSKESTTTTEPKK